MTEPEPEVRAESPPAEPTRGQAAREWIALLGPPLLVFVQVFAGYMVSGEACERGRWVSHLTLALCFAGAAGCTWLAGRIRAAGTSDRARFFGLAALIGGTVSLLALLAQWVPIIGLDPCSRA
jgi:hypothetical protein